MNPDSTRQLVAEMKTTHRDTLVRGLCIASTAILVFVLVVSVTGDALGETRPVMVVPEDVDLVAYSLPETCTLTDLAERLWQNEVSPHEVLRYNRDVPDVTAPLAAGTVIAVPNFRDFPVEELAALP